MRGIDCISRRTTRVFAGSAVVAILLVGAGASSRGPGQSSSHGVVMPLGSAKPVSDGEPPCLNSALENGDPGTGASTFLVEAAPGCVVPPHYHTAEEQLLIVRGDMLTGMEGMSSEVLGSGGFAMMPSK